MVASKLHYLYSTFLFPSLSTAGVLNPCPQDPLTDQVCKKTEIHHMWYICCCSVDCTILICISPWKYLKFGLLVGLEDRSWEPLLYTKHLVAIRRKKSCCSNTLNKNQAIKDYIITVLAHLLTCPSALHLRCSQLSFLSVQQQLHPTHSWPKTSICEALQDLRTLYHQQWIIYQFLVSTSRQAS